MLIDAHAHLDKYGEQLPDALREIEEQQILTISVSMDLPSYEVNLEAGRLCPLVLPAFGIHPWNAPQFADRLEELEGPLLQTPLIGEIGLDFWFVKEKDSYAAQHRVFEQFLRAARKQEKIVNLHTKGAEADVLDLLARHDIRRAIVHWYSGPRDVLLRLVDREVYFTVGVEVLRSAQIQEIARVIPEHQLLTETDNPGAMEWLSGQPGKPAQVREVVTALAGIRGCSVEELAARVRDNLVRLFADDPRLASYRRHLTAQ